MVEKLIPDPFPKTQKLSTSHDISFILFFIVCPNQRLPEFIEILLVLTTCFYLISKRDHIIFYYKFTYYKITNFVAQLSLLLEILGNMYIVIICFPVYNVYALKLPLAFLSTRFF